MTQLPNCPACDAAYTYTDGTFLICPQCAHEWTQEASDTAQDPAECVKDAHGTILNDGDTISVIKDLKIKGSSQVVKVGTKVRNIRLHPGSDHNIDCKIDGIGAMKLKSEFVKKV
ncbi:alkylphosphonate uptake protein PhnA [Legionella geestiana]|uniref:Alkylphosphonate uptake protein PhnA n=1 Tax=Legionella geestiana TaxID=45065 RepID=A0A0W0TT96_9GAMM|nr:zinc ribbon domain-containing protein YjdM [Legionella geestiana]KTC98841.1 alkylphosphonate uptake protein PhnA [Legionella geestiana]QBS12766.1 alkylphosphonate utilization protein [Legionella geestiana]QDQ39517.1 alkylphosphonate utilization protein [Legionella geestiana]STX54759.1 alkylphosphonate uptake protein PhnA [Legionella geestiana]